MNDRLCCAFAAISMFFCAPPALGGDFARDPCPAPLVLGAASADFQTDYVQLAARAAELDTTAAQFNKECDVQNVVGSTPEVSCATRETQITADLDTHAKNVETYNSHLNDVFQSQLSALEEKAAGLRTELAKAPGRAAEWQRDIDEWAELGASARSETRLHAAFAALDIVLDSERDELKENIALNQDALAKIRALYASGNRYIPEEFRGALAREVASMRTKRDLLLMLQQLNLTADRAYSLYEPLSKDKYAEGLGQFTVGVLRESLLLMEASPEAKASVVALDTAEHSLYGWWAAVVAAKRVAQFTDLEEPQFQAVKKLSGMYISNIDAQKALKSAHADLLHAACFKSN